jgi:receptor-binding protein
MDSLSRRELLTGAGAILAAGTVGAPTASARPVRTDELTPTKRFKMSATTNEFFRSKPLWGPTVMQSFAFDTPNNRLFTGQLCSGTGENSGDLTLSQLNFSGTVLGHMYLTGFGHAVSIGAQAVGGTSYIWTETDVDTGNGRGRQICRFPWQNGATLSASSVTKWKPVAGGSVFTPAVDSGTGSSVCATRNPTGCTQHLQPRCRGCRRLFDGAGVLQATGADLRDRLPGMDAVRRLVRVLLGGRGLSGEPDETKANSKLWCYDINAGKIVDSFLTLAGKSLTYREAEGMVVYGSTDATARLYFGFASGVTGDRRANLFYRNDLM